VLRGHLSRGPGRPMEIDWYAVLRPEATFTGWAELSLLLKGALHGAGIDRWARTLGSINLYGSHRSGKSCCAHGTV